LANQEKPSPSVIASRPTASCFAADALAQYFQSFRTNVAELTSFLSTASR